MPDSKDYRLFLETKFEVVNAKLDSIDGRLKTLNGKVAEHEKTINKNLPHTIAQCSQAKVINELKEWQAEQDGVETAEQSFMKRSEIAKELEATKKRDGQQFAFNAVTAILTIVMIIVTIYFSSKSSRSAKAAETEAKTTNEIVAPALRGNTYTPPAFRETDTTSKARFFDTLDFDRLMNKIK